jgi:transposase
MPHPTAGERMMKVQEVLMRAIDREITWIQAAEILGCTTRSLRRWKLRYRTYGMRGLVDGRTRGHRSPRWISPQDVEPLLRLYRERYRGFNVRHFCSIARREHRLVWSYSFVRQALQAAGLVRKRRPRGRHFMRRPPRPCVGELLHVDGSHHVWLALRPGERQCLVAVVDDATRRLLYAQLSERETTEAVMAALYQVFTQHGLPADPARAFVTAGGAPLDQILCHEELRHVAKDNTVVLAGVRLQIAKQPGRATCAGLRVVVRRHLDGTHSVWRGPRCWGRFDARGRAAQRVA